MFPILQNVLVSRPHTACLQLSPLVHVTLNDWILLASTLSQHPTPITHLVPTAPTYVGTTDTLKQGMGGVWFPTSLAMGPLHPLIWHLPFSPSIQNDLVSFQNPQGSSPMLTWSSFGWPLVLPITLLIPLPTCWLVVTTPWKLPDGVEKALPLPLWLQPSSFATLALSAIMHR